MVSSATYLAPPHQAVLTEAHGWSIGDSRDRPSPIYRLVRSQSCRVLPRRAASTALDPEPAIAAVHTSCTDIPRSLRPHQGPDLRVARPILLIGVSALFNRSQRRHARLFRGSELFAATWLRELARSPGTTVAKLRQVRRDDESSALDI